MAFFLRYSPESESSCGRVANLSDEEIFLASRYPKKRAGRKKTRHPVYRNVRWRNSGKCVKWVCEVREPNKKSVIWLGTFATAEMAARAHDVAAIALRGRFACLNFADSAWKLPVPASGDAKDIQMTAAEAAEAFRPADSLMETSSETVAEDERQSPERVFFMDDEELFGMPGLLASMAEAMLLPTPNFAGDAAVNSGNDEEASADVSLWSYEI